MTELTLNNIQTYLLNTSGPASCTASLINGVSNSKITDIDTFLLEQIKDNTTSYTRKGNFLELYNDQYNQNIEIAVGIFIISAVLAKMMFYPINLQ